MQNHIYTPASFSNKINLGNKWKDSRVVFRQKNNVLLVQNDPVLMNILNSLLLEAKFNVVTLNSGEEALLSLKKESIDLIVSDIRLADMSGLGLIKKIRSKSNNSYLSNIPIILLTSQSKDLELLAISIGVDMLCQKRKVKKNLVSQIKLLLE
jgi:CheY-like chemotaxis protein